MRTDPMQRIHLDFNGSTPLAPEAREAMVPLLTCAFGRGAVRFSLGRTTTRAGIEEVVGIMRRRLRA